MTAKTDFEIVPFQWRPAPDSQEYAATQDEQQFERGGRAFAGRSRPSSSAPRSSSMRSSPPRRSVSKRTSPLAKPSRRPPGRPPTLPPRRPVPVGVGRLRLVDNTPLWMPADPFQSAPSMTAGGTEQGRWAQDCLNKIQGLQLPVNGVMGADTRSALRRFQQQQGLPVTGIIGPDTEDALKGACKGAAAPTGSDASSSTSSSDTAQDNASQDDAAQQELFGNVFTRLRSGFGGIAGSAGKARIIDLTAKADKSKRKGTRDPKTVRALVLHQMACCFKPKDPMTRFLSLGAHFAILPDGRILQLHPVTSLLWASNGFNHRSVAVEFAGNFPDTRGRWWKGEQYGRNQPTAEQITAGRYLVAHLKKQLGITHVLAHRQSSGTRENDPGPTIWKGVGQWAVAKLGMKDGGPGFKIDSGNPIPDAWRNGIASSAAKPPSSGVKNEFTGLFESGYGNAGEQEIPPAMQNTLAKIPAAQRPNYTAVGPLSTAANHALANGPGLYLLTFTVDGKQRAYSGETENLKRRIGQHRLCARILGVPAHRYQVYIASMPRTSFTPQQRRSIEKTIHTDMLTKNRGVLTNQNQEIETELLNGWT